MNPRAHHLPSNAPLCRNGTIVRRVTGYHNMSIASEAGGLGAARPQWAEALAFMCRESVSFNQILTKNSYV